VEQNLTEIAKLPDERTLWWVRQLYQLPPTDPRLLAMTDEQIMLEREHYLIDHPELKKEMYRDPEYEEWERKAVAEDSKLNTIRVNRPPEKSGAAKRHTEAEQSFNSDEWEDVEIDDNPST
jgi:hypothetical protein